MMNSTSKLSVIIPLYNAGDDFRTCMESLITQTWTALEIIIINDGSTDNSVEIAKHYAEKLSARSFVASGECWPHR
ncbi:glycosyl transferase [Escherichia coli]|uniref:Glycosyl transferase n=1 Tax=Escherichia coli TaxID=562 RepID=A0A376TYK0_ECOLX|nr:glycosyl transferase [Escherichia coli]